MPNNLHEAILLLFRNRPLLAAEFIGEHLGGGLPTYTGGRVEAAELTEVQPAEYRADLVILLEEQAVTVAAIVLEVQISRDATKLYSWPTYAVNLRARHRCPTLVLVVAPDESVARWASQSIDLGGDNSYRVKVLPSSAIPLPTDRARIHREPEWAALCLMAHGADTDPEIVVALVQEALESFEHLDADRSTFYSDLVIASLGEAAKKALMAMNPVKYELQSDIVKHWVDFGRDQGLAEGKARGEAKGKAEGKAEGEAKGKAEGKAEGEAKGKAEIVLKLLRLKFGPVNEAVETRIRSMSIEQLDNVAERILGENELARVFDT